MDEYHTRAGYLLWMSIACIPILHSMALTDLVRGQERRDKPEPLNLLFNSQPSSQGKATLYQTVIFL